MSAGRALLQLDAWPTRANVLMQARDQASFVVIDDPDLRQTSTGLAVMAQHLQLITLARQHVLA